MKLQGKIALVTGASSGMGREIAYLFAKEGATVYAVARRKERLDNLANETKDFEGKILALTADLMKKDEAENIVDLVYKDAGQLNILVNNTGIMDDFSPIGEVSDEMLEKVFALNFYAPFYTMRKAVKVFLEQGSGVIVNTSSLSGLYGARAGAVYTASKHALIGLTKNTAFIYAKDNIRCNAICPGGVDTEIGSGAFMSHINKKGSDIIFANSTGNPRSGSPEEIAKIALFLASDDSSFINGHALVADSGWSAF